jgi:hypothetical protein
VTSMVRGEPDYVDQVPRRHAYEKTHPDVEILYLGPYWRAVVPEDDGETVIVRYDLRQLLDKLESLDGPQTARQALPTLPGLPR